MPTGLFMREKPVKLLLALKASDQGRTISQLAAASGMSFVHASNLVTALKTANIVDTHKTGRIRIVILTLAGIELASALETAMARLSPPQTAPPPEQAAPQAQQPLPSEPAGTEEAKKE